MLKTFKKLFATITAIGLVFTNISYVSSYAVDSSYTLGDVNTDGIIDARDLLRTRRVLLGRDRLTSNFRTLGDINEDGTLNVLDLLEMKQVVLGVKSTSSKSVAITPDVSKGSATIIGLYDMDWEKDADKGIVDLTVTPKNHNKFTIDSELTAGSTEKLVFNSVVDSDTVSLVGDSFNASSNSLNLREGTISVKTEESSLNSQIVGNTTSHSYRTKLGKTVTLQSTIEGDDNAVQKMTNGLLVTATCSDNTSTLQTNESGDFILGEISWDEENKILTLGDCVVSIISDTESTKVAIINSDENYEKTFELNGDAQLILVGSLTINVYPSTGDVVSMGITDNATNEFIGVELQDSTLNSLTTLVQNNKKVIRTQYNSSYSANYKSLSVDILNNVNNTTLSRVWFLDLSNVGDKGQVVLFNNNDTDYSICDTEIIDSEKSVVLEKCCKDSEIQNIFTLYNTNTKETLGNSVITRNADGLALGGVDYQSQVIYGLTDGSVERYYGETASYGVSLLHNSKSQYTECLVLADHDPKSQIFDYVFSYRSF